MPLRFLLTFLLASFSAIAADIPKPFAHYRSEDIRAEGASVQAWADQTTAARTLDRVAGKPRVRLVSTPSGEKRIVCLDGRSAIWQASNAWGTLDGDRTIILLARVASKEDGFLFDGSTKSGSAPAQVVAGKWKTAATVSSEPQPGAWQVLTFVFPKDPPLGGFILGANVAAASGLACDVAEVMGALGRDADAGVLQLAVGGLGEAQPGQDEGRRAREGGLLKKVSARLGVFHGRCSAS